LRMVGPAQLYSDSAGFLIHIVNDGTDEDTVKWIVLTQAPDTAYMREFTVDAAPPFVIPAGSPGIGKGDTVDIGMPFVVQPNMSAQVDLGFMDFHRDINGDSTKSFINGKTFRLRFSDGSEITAVIPLEP
jgi:hypothetical protein